MRQHSRKSLSILPALLACMLAGPVWAQSEPSMESPYISLALLDEKAGGATHASAPAADGWHWGLDLYTWLPGLTGDIGGRGQVSNVDVTAFDIFDKAEAVIGFSARLEVGVGKWLGYIDTTYIRIESGDIPVATGMLDFKTEIGMFTTGVYYQVAQWTPNGAGASGYPLLTLDAGLGCRIMSVNLELDYTDGLTLHHEGSRTWADPLVAAQLAVRLDDRWQLLFRGDIGAGSSDLTWQAGGFASYHFKLFSKLDASVNVGYQAIAATYENGTGSDRFLWDAVMHGPVIFLAIDF